MTTNSKQPGPDELSDLEWNAFRFVSGEMTDDEQAAFEIQLGDNPAAAVAVSRVLELGEAIELASSRPAVVVAPTSQTESGRSSIVVVASLAACALVAFLLVSPDKATTSNTRVAATQPVEVIETWLDVEPLQVTFEPISIDEDEELELAMLEPVNLDTSDEVVPDWMYAAFQDEDANGVSFE